MKLNPIKTEIAALWSQGKSVTQIEIALNVKICFGRSSGVFPQKEIAVGDYEVYDGRPINLVPRQTSPRTGDAIWMKFECGAGSRYTSTTEDDDGRLCNYSGCDCGTRVRKVGETDDRGANWFGLHAGKLAEKF